MHKRGILPRRHKPTKKSKEPKTSSAYRKMQWEKKILDYIFNIGSGKRFEPKPFNISDMSGYLKISQPIAWRKCSELFRDGLIVEHHRDHKEGPGGREKIFYIPSIDLLFYKCFQELKLAGKIQEERGEKPHFPLLELPSYKAFKTALDFWWHEEKFIQSICNREKLWANIEPTAYLTEEFVKNEPEIA